MEIITSLEQLHTFSAPCVVALGTFTQPVQEG